MTHLSFPNLSGKLVNLRKLSMDDTATIVSLMSYEISKYLYEVLHPYKIDDALKFIKSSCDDFKSHKTIIFAIDYKNKSQSIKLLVELSVLKILILLIKKQI
ncbi:MAG TPA: hypothetical protein VHJ38_13585 [Nitrososphaeraceae archaeon]|jgi:hypothetical protein|nr:hypothetical protein [Nitrososphaeraceae archaeon]